MSLTTGRRLNHQSFTPLPLPQDVINGVHCFTLRNPKGLDIRDRYRRPFLKPEDRANNYDDDSTYTSLDNNNSNKKDESDNNESDNDDNANLHLPPDQEMAQGPAGVTIHDNAGVQKNGKSGVHQITKNSGVHQNVNTHSSHNVYNEPQNDPTIKTENTIDVTGNGHQAKDEGKNQAENEDKNEHKDLEEVPTKNDSADAEHNDATDPDTV